MVQNDKIFNNPTTAWRLQVFLWTKVKMMALQGFPQPHAALKKIFKQCQSLWTIYWTLTLHTQRGFHRAPAFFGPLGDASLLSYKRVGRTNSGGAACGGGGGGGRGGGGSLNRVRTGQKFHDIGILFWRCSQKKGLILVNQALLQGVLYDP